MTRSVWKGPYSEIRPSFISSMDERELKNKVWSRRSMILPTYIGKKVVVHNGRIFIRLNISKDMIGHKFGEFALTRKKPRHKINKKKQVARRNKK